MAGRRHDPQRAALVADVIHRAAALIRKRGLCIGALTDPDGRVCLMGAIREAAAREPRAIRYAAYDAVNRALRRPGHEWNDEQTDKERVASLLNGVASRLSPTTPRPDVCWHARPICTHCQAAIACTDDRCQDNFTYGQHKANCPTLRPPATIAASV